MNLENDFTATTITLAPDYEGEVIATLVSSNNNKGNRRSVLYIHGFIDYFFHPHVCEAFHANNYDFYALDLRKCGRSILPHQKPNYCENIEEYYEEITASIDIIRKQSTQIFLLGHSTGGLISSSYLNNGEGRKYISGLMLNSPFLDMAHSTLFTNFSYAISIILTKVKPLAYKKNALSSIYPESVHKDYNGDWFFDLSWKPIEGFPMYFKWYIAIVKAQRNLKRSNIEVPILLLHSNHSFVPKKHSAAVMKADIVLNVEDMKRIGPTLGTNTKLVAIKNGPHDLFLSPPKIRNQAFAELFLWLDTINE